MMLSGNKIVTTVTILSRLTGSYLNSNAAVTRVLGGGTLVPDNYIDIAENIALGKPLEF